MKGPRDFPIWLFPGGEAKGRWWWARIHPEPHAHPLLFHLPWFVYSVVSLSPASCLPLKDRALSTPPC